MNLDLKPLLPSRMYDLIERANIATAEKLLTLSENDIKSSTHMNSADINFIKNIVAKCILPEDFKTGLDLLHKSNQLKSIPTACDSIDKVLNGGFCCRTITEIYGESASGKTQVCLQATAQCWETGAVYICTEDPFPTKRLHQMLEKQKKSSEASKCSGDNIFVEHLAEVDELKLCLRVKLPNLLRKKQNIALLVIDSIAAPFRGSYTNYIQRAKDMKEIAALLLEVATQYNLAVICVNQVTANFTEGDLETSIPCLGLAWSNLINTRIQIKRTEDIVRINSNDFVEREFKVVFSSYLEERSTNFAVCSDGLISLK